ncbi:MAG: OmpH family outer membrane protein [Bacteroidetes bacterium]|nr:OmpH family outer membrane protein [Bacteroidota bacterium]
MNKNQSSTYPKIPIYSALILSTAAVVLTVLLFLKRDTIVYVDSMKLLSQYKGTIQAKAAYDKKVAVWKANIDTLTSELNAQITTYQKDKKKLSAREQKLTEELIGTKQQQLANYKSAISENASKEDQTITAQVYKEINDFLKKYGEEHGYDYILGANNTGNVVFAKPGKNITEAVLKELNGEFHPAKK